MISQNAGSVNFTVYSDSKFTVDIINSNGTYKITINDKKISNQLDLEIKTLEQEIKKYVKDATNFDYANAILHDIESYDGETIIMKSDNIKKVIKKLKKIKNPPKIKKLKFDSGIIRKLIKHIMRTHKLESIKPGPGVEMVYKIAKEGKSKDKILKSNLYSKLIDLAKS